jgi:[ribosomal protein S18]-alanine N-acetyltransferase
MEIIRKYKSDDLEELVHLLQLNIPDYFAASEENDFVDYLENHLEDYFVMTHNGKIIGSGGINYFYQDNSSRISWDIVHPDFQGKGIGSKLTQYRLELIRKNASIETIIVRTTQLVYKFYEKMGFELEKTEEDFWAKGFDLYQMKIRLK